MCNSVETHSTILPDTYPKPFKYLQYCFLHTFIRMGHDGTKTENRFTTIPFQLVQKIKMVSICISKEVINTIQNTNQHSYFTEKTINSLFIKGQHVST